MSYPETPPRRLSSRPTDPDFRYWYADVGVILDGKERRDVRSYDVDRGRLFTIHGEVVEGRIEPFWRWPESRQERRRRERDDASRGELK